MTTSTHQAFVHYTSSMTSLELIGSMPDDQRPETFMVALVHATLAIAAMLGAGETPPTSGAAFS